MSSEFDEDTLPESPWPAPRKSGPGQPVEVCFLDFKQGRTIVAVTHGPEDPSRICIALRSASAIMQVTVEEGVGRQVAEGLADVLRTFRAVRSRLR